MKALVTGGGGFLGKAMVRQLVARGDQVRSYSRGRYPELTDLGVDVLRGDLADARGVASAVEGIDLVFHVAARAGIWGAWNEYHRTNVVGTENVLTACKRHGVGGLVYTSSPSVVFHNQDMEGVDESVPYPETYLAHYPKTKAMAERRVLEANSPELATVALRPHLIWGPGDNHLVPRILERGRAGKLKRIGTEPKLVDSVYIEDAARAHLLAGDTLSPGSRVAGKVYFISQGEPLPVWDLVNRILGAGGVGPVEKTVSPRLALVAGWVLEVVYRALGRKSEPPMTRFLARQLSTAHWFDISAARRDLGFEPGLSIQEGIQKLAESLGSPGS